VKGSVFLNYFVMHFFISTHLQVNPSILNLRLIMEQKGKSSLDLDFQYVCNKM